MNLSEDTSGVGGGGWGAAALSLPCMSVFEVYGTPHINL